MPLKQRWGGMTVNPKAIANPSLLSSGPDGAGPYVLDKSGTVLNSTYTFSRNPKYWDPQAFPYNTVVIKVIAVPTAALYAVRSGQVELAPGTAADVSAAKYVGLTIPQQAGDFRGLWINDITGKQVPAREPEGAAGDAARDQPAGDRGLRGRRDADRADLPEGDYRV